MTLFWLEEQISTYFWMLNIILSFEEIKDFNRWNYILVISFCFIMTAYYVDTKFKPKYPWNCLVWCKAQINLFKKALIYVWLNGKISRHSFFALLLCVTYCIKHSISMLMIKGISRIRHYLLHFYKAAFYIYKKVNKIFCTIPFSWVLHKRTYSMGKT